MRPGTKACYGASTVGAFSGIMMAATGAVLVLISAYQNQRVEETEWMIVAMLCATGFLILIISLMCCSCALCRHASVSEEAQMALENKIFSGRVHPADTQEAVWTVEGSRPSWESPTSSLPGQIEDLGLEDLETNDGEEEEVEQLEAPLAEPEPDVEPETPDDEIALPEEEEEVAVEPEVPELEPEPETKEEEPEEEKKEEG